ncbi:MAG: hypothetical protein IV100_19155 [Myxococcales bacterium]|nr:hypothetical protein [Myxococcales bacterium]
MVLERARRLLPRRKLISRRGAVAGSGRSVDRSTYRRNLAHGGRLISKALKAQGVDVVFTLCGGHIQAIYDGCLDEGIRVVDTRHERSAAHAADGWVRATGPPVCRSMTDGEILGERSSTGAHVG